MTAVTILSAKTSSFGRNRPFRPGFWFLRPSQFWPKGAISAERGLFRPKELVSADRVSDGRYTVMEEIFAVTFGRHDGRYDHRHDDRKPYGRSLIPVVILLCTWLPRNILLLDSPRDKRRIASFQPLRLEATRNWSGSRGRRAALIIWSRSRITLGCKCAGTRSVEISPYFNFKRIHIHLQSVS